MSAEACERLAGDCGAVQQAFDGITSAVIFDAILHKAPIPAARLNVECPPDLGRIIRELLEKDRKFRYQSAREILVDLQRLRHIPTSDRQAKGAQVQEQLSIFSFVTRMPSARVRRPRAV